MKGILRYFFRYKKITFFILFQILFIQLFQLLKPWPVKFAFDYLIEKKNLPFSAVGYLPFDTQLFILCASFVLIYFLLGAFVLLNNISKIYFGNAILTDFRMDIYRKLQRIQISYFNKKSAGDIIYRTINDTQSIQVISTKIIFPLISSIILLFGIFIVIFQINQKLLFVFFFTIPVLFLSISFLNKAIFKVSNKLREKESKLLSTVEYFLNNISIVRIFNMEDSEYKKFQTSSSDALSLNLKLNIFETIHAWVVNTLIALGIAVILWFGVKQVLSNDLTIGDLIIFISYLESLYGPINSISQSISLYYESRAGIKRVLSLLNEKELIVDGHERIKDNIINYIEFKNVNFLYESNDLLIKDANFKIFHSDKVALVGKSGSGKTTIASLLVRFIEPIVGEILINDKNIKEFELRSLRDSICLVGQRPILFNGTILENIKYSSFDRSDCDIDEILKIVCLDDFVKSLPDGIYTNIGERGYMLSEGQRQRISLARALLTNAGVFIFDEATSAIDIDTQKDIFENILNRFQDKTIIYTTHRPENERYSDYLLVIKEGRIIKTDKSDYKI